MRTRIANLLYALAGVVILSAFFLEPPLGDYDRLVSSAVAVLLVSAATLDARSLP